MDDPELKVIKRLIIIKIAVIVWVYLLILLFHNSLSPAFAVLAILANSFFAVGTIGNYGIYIVLKKLRENSEKMYEEYEKTYHER